MGWVSRQRERHVGALRKRFIITAHNDEHVSTATKREAAAPRTPARTCGMFSSGHTDAKRRPHFLPLCPSPNTFGPTAIHYGRTTAAARLAEKGRWVLRIPPGQMPRPAMPCPAIICPARRARAHGMYNLGFSKGSGWTKKQVLKLFRAPCNDSLLE